jgi:hypothetical protein
MKAGPQRAAAGYKNAEPVGFRLRENLPLVGDYIAGFFAVFASGLRAGFDGFAFSLAANFV